VEFLEIHKIGKEFRKNGAERIKNCEFEKTSSCGAAFPKKRRMRFQKKEK